jgi:hypothetical protein
MPNKDVDAELPAPLLLDAEDVNKVAAGSSVVAIGIHPPTGSLGSWWYLGRPPFKF